MHSFAQIILFCALIKADMKKKIAILASGEGTNAENIIRYFKENETATVELVVTNKPEAGVIARAEALKVTSLYLPKDEWSNCEKLLSQLKAHEIDFIVLAGFLLRVPDAILHEYPDKIINIHPSLLPKYGGKGMYGNRVHEAVVAAKENQSGITIHYINERYDEGNVICQQLCEVLPNDTPEMVAQKVHQLEYHHYPQVIERLLKSLNEKS